MRALHKKGLELWSLINVFFFTSFLFLLLGLSAQIASIDHPLGAIQTSVLNVGFEGDKALIFLDDAADLAAVEAIDLLHESAGFVRDFEDGSYPCGEYLTVPYWKSPDKSCIPDYEESVRYHFQRSLFQKLSSHPLYVFPYGFSYTFTQSGDQLKVDGHSPEPMRFPFTTTDGDYTLEHDEHFTPDYIGAAQPTTLNYGSRAGREVTNIVVHYTRGGSLAGAVNTLKKEGKSYHYIIDTDGTINQYVPESESAQHAGCSGDNCLMPDMNQPSIGISFVNNGDLQSQVDPKKCYAGTTAECYAEYTEAQINSFVILVADIVKRHELLLIDGKLNRDAIIMHSEIDTNKKDPGPAFTDQKGAIYDRIDVLIPEDEERIPYDEETTTGNKLTGNVAKSTQKKIDQYASIIDQYAEARDLDPAIIKALIAHESAGNAQAKSPANAFGLMQIVPFSSKGSLINHDTCVNSGCGFTPASTMDDVRIDEYLDPAKNICCGTLIFQRASQKKPVTWKCCGQNINPGVCIDTEYVLPYDIGARRYNGMGCGPWADPDYVESINALYAGFGGDPSQMGYKGEASMKASYEIPVSFETTINFDLEKHKTVENFARSIAEDCIDLVDECIATHIQEYNQQEGVLPLTEDCGVNKFYNTFVSSLQGCELFDEKTMCEFSINDSEVAGDIFTLYIDQQGVWGLQEGASNKHLYQKTGLASFIGNDGVRTEAESIKFRVNSLGMTTLIDNIEYLRNLLTAQYPFDFYNDLSNPPTLVLSVKAKTKTKTPQQPSRIVCEDVTLSGNQGSTPLQFAWYQEDRIPPAIDDYQAAQIGDMAGSKVKARYNEVLKRIEAQWPAVTTYPDGKRVKDIKEYRVYCTFQNTIDLATANPTLTLTRTDGGYFDPEVYNGLTISVPIETCDGTLVSAMGMGAASIFVIPVDHLGQYNKTGYYPARVTVADTAPLSQTLYQPQQTGETIEPRPNTGFPFTDVTTLPEGYEAPQDGCKPNSEHRIGVLGSSSVSNGGFIDYLNTLGVGHFYQHGYAGKDSSYLRGVFDEDILGNNYDEVIIFNGVNDLPWNMDLTMAQSKENLQAMYTKAGLAGLRVIAITIQPTKGATSYWDGSTSARDPEVTATKTTTLNNWILTEAADVDVVVDIYAALEDPSRQGYMLTQYAASDQLHMNAAGHQLLGQLIYTTAYTGTEDCSTATN